MNDEGENLLEWLTQFLQGVDFVLESLEKLQRDHKDEITPQTGRQIALARTNIEQGRLWLGAAHAARTLEMDAAQATWAKEK